MTKVIRVSGIGVMAGDNSEFQIRCPICGLTVFLFKEDLTVNCPVCSALVVFAVIPTKDNSH